MRALIRATLLLWLFTQPYSAWADDGAASPQEPGKAAPLHDLESGKLIQYGITGGVGLALMMPSAFSIENRRPQMANVTAMPYIGFLPAFWSGNEVKSRFCANALTSKADPTTAKRAADAKATVIAEAASKKLTAAEAADPSVAAATPGPDKAKALAALPARIAKSLSPALSAALAAEPTLDLKKTEKVTEALSPLLFDPKDTTPCFWYKWGFYVGVPLSYRVQVVHDEAAESIPRPTGFPADAMPSYASTQMNPGFAAGLLFAPNAYISLLLGASYVTFSDEGAPGRLYHSVVPTFALGGNLDIFGVILPSRKPSS